MTNELTSRFLRGHQRVRRRRARYLLVPSATVFVASIPVFSENPLGNLVSISKERLQRPPWNLGSRVVEQIISRVPRTK